jgi:hypothetical protein
VIGLRKYAFSWHAVGRRFHANQGLIPRSINTVRAVSSEGTGRIRYDSKVLSLLDRDQALRRFFEGETRDVPLFYTDQVRADLGPWWDFLPDGALQHDQNAYLRASSGRFSAEPVPVA